MRGHRGALLVVAVSLLLPLPLRTAAKAKGAGGFEGVECPEGFELQENGACVKPLEDDEPLAPPIDLLEAAERGDDGAVAAFLADGADPNARNGRGQTALHLAARHGHDEVCELLLDGTTKAQIDAVDDEGQQPLHLTVPNGFFDTFKLLTDHGADPNSPIGGGSTLLHFASFKGTAEAVEFMLDNGCKADMPDRDGARPLHAAAYAGKKDIVEVLVTKGGTDVNVQDKTGATALHLAAQQKQVYMCKALLELGADPDLADSSGATPVLVATHTNAGAVLAELLQAMNGRRTARELKRRHGPLKETLLHHAAKAGHVDVVKTLVKQKEMGDLIDAMTVLPSTKDVGQEEEEEEEEKATGHTALILAAQAGHYKVCKALLQAGADPTLPAAYGEMDLLTACAAADKQQQGKTKSKAGGGGLWQKLKKLLEEDIVQKLEGAAAAAEKKAREAQQQQEQEQEQEQEQDEAERKATAELLRSGLEATGMSKPGVDIALDALNGWQQQQEPPDLAELKGKLKLGDRKRLEGWLADNSKDQKKKKKNEGSKEEL